MLHHCQYIPLGSFTLLWWDAYYSVTQTLLPGKYSLNSLLTQQPWWRQHISASNQIRTLQVWKQINESSTIRQALHSVHNVASEQSYLLGLLWRTGFHWMPQISLEGPSSLIGEQNRWKGTELMVMMTVNILHCYKRTFQAEHIR
jgi:hypothetical protein